MQNFSLQSQFKISGLGSCSGLVFIDNLLYIISDNSTFLYKYDIKKDQLIKLPLLKNSQENIPKAEKPDFEAIAVKGKKLCILGSGSTENRNLMMTFHLEKEKRKTVDLGFLYQIFKQKFDIADDDFNIEGIIYHKKLTLFFQRGNGSKSKNGIIKIDNEIGSMSFHEIKLPKIGVVEASFTDAIIVGKKIYFLAAVENTDSTYNDGEILGSYIGCMNLNFEIKYTEKISDTHKFEGLTLLNKSKSEINFLLCEDNDTEHLESVIYKLKLEK